MKKLIYFLLLLTPSFLYSQEIVEIELDVDGVQRSANLYINSTYQDGDEWPLIINMHGLGSNAAQQEFYSYFDLVADTSKFLLVYPDGLLNSQGTTHWNAGFGTGVDDVGFINVLIDHMHQSYNIDLSRVYSTGMSNGGYMSYTLACELSDRIAAIASITGAMVENQENNCSPSYAPPILQMHGTADPTVPYDGNAIQRSIPDLIEYWKEQHGCSDDHEYIEYPDIDMEDNTTVESFSYTDCTTGGEVKFYKIENGGHTWPGAIMIPELGNVTRDIIASNEVWEFFQKYQHPNPLVVSGINDIDQQKSNLKIFPNPSTGFINLESELTLTNIKVFNSLGGIVLSAKDQNNGLDISTLNNGFYTISASTKDGHYEISQFVLAK